MSKIVQTAGRNALGKFAPEFAHYNDDVLFGENWNNQDIDVKTRSIITVVALMASGITDSSLKFHLENAKAHGVTQNILSAKATLPRFRRVRSAFTTSPSNRAAATIGTSITQKTAAVKSLFALPDAVIIKKKASLRSK